MTINTYTSYLDKATNFEDIEIKDKPETKYPGLQDMKYLCPVCLGHGKWNLELNSYGEGKHFQQSCFQCNSWGYVREKDYICIHEFKELSQKECKEESINHYGNCDHVYRCLNCNQIRHVDSSG